VGDVWKRVDFWIRQFCQTQNGQRNQRFSR
jgi:hypothetical protein